MTLERAWRNVCTNFSQYLEGDATDDFTALLNTTLIVLCFAGLCWIANGRAKRKRGRDETK